MKNIFNLLFFIFLFIGSLFSANIQFEADKTTLDSKKESLILEGNVSLNYESLLFKADKVTLDRKNKIFSSEKISFSSLDNFLYGETKFVSITEEETILQSVEFSSCPCKDKIWWIESEELSFLNSENVLRTKKSKLIVQGQTLAYLNNAEFPTSAKRKSGILIPEISINERSGLDIKIPIYLNLKENIDLTLEPRLITQRGYGLTNQLRYLGKDYEGYFNSSFLMDDESSFRTLERDDLRWSYDFYHEQNFGDSVFLNIETSSSGDPFYLSDLGSFLSGLSRTYILPQKLNLNYFKNNLNIRADINSFKLTNPLAENQFQRLPGFKLDYFVNKNNFNFHFDFDFALFRKGGSFRNDNKQNLKRLFITPKISYAVSINNYFLETSLFINHIFQDFENISNEEFLPTLKFNQSLKFFKKNTTGKLFIEPFLNLTISDNKKIVNKVKVDSGLRLSSMNEQEKFGDLFLSYQRDINFGTKLSFYGDNKNKTVFKISKLYTNGQKKLFYENLRFDLPEPFVIDLDYKLDKNIYYNSSLSIDDKYDFSSFKNAFKINYDKYKISLGHYLIKNISIFNLKNNLQELEKINSLEFTASLNFSKNWSGGVKIINDLEKKKNITNVFSIDYENDGMIVGIAYMKSLEPDWVSILENNSFKDYHKDRLRLFFELKGLGSIGRPKEDYLKRRGL